MKTNQQITVWPDDTEGRHNRKWIVSRDEGDDGSSKTISHHKCECDAIIIGRRLAECERLPLVTKNDMGQSTCHMDHLHAGGDK